MVRDPLHKPHTHPPTRSVFLACQTQIQGKRGLMRVSRFHPHRARFTSSGPLLAFGAQHAQRAKGRALSAEETQDHLDACIPLELLTLVSKLDSFWRHAFASQVSATARVTSPPSPSYLGNPSHLLRPAPRAESCMLQY
jgi:hypothetical protein